MRLDRLGRALVLAAASALAMGGAFGQQWIAPTPEELKMTSIAEVPDAKAVVLFREEKTDDDYHVKSRYFRVKVLTEAGKDLGDVRIGFDQRAGNGYEVGEVAGRTIQPDGTIVPFTGKPYEKIFDQGKGYKRAFKVFSLPAVQVGSILEYRYTLRWDDKMFWSPEWDIQSEDLYLRKGHFLWKPTDKTLLSTSRGGHEDLTSRLVWNAVLPKGVEVQKTVLPSGRTLLEVNVQNVPPFGVEEYMPPMQSTAYHVYFYYSPYHSPQEYWKTEGGYWSGETNKFVGNSGAVRDAATAAIAGAASDEEKAKKLYALAQTIDNTDFSRVHSKVEEKSDGFKETKNAEDVLRRKRGSSDQIAMTYAALARAVGLNASVMVVSDRTYQIMNANWLDFNRQLSDDIVIVSYNGSDHFLDPGSPLCSFGHLAWNHSLSGGVRQQGKDTALVPTPAEGYKDSRTARVADLKLEEGGQVTGTVSLTFQGSPAVEWRQTALRNDEAELREELTKYVQSILPGGTEAKIKTLEGVASTAVPLKVVFAVEGNLGSAAGSRVVLPSDVFVEHQRPAFPHAQRDQPVYFHYAQMNQDAMRITYPPSLELESVPVDDKVMFKQSAIYVQRAKAAGNSVTVWRDLMVGEIYYPVDEYGELRKFYADFEHKDHASIVLKRTSPGATTKAAGSGE